MIRWSIIGTSLISEIVIQSIRRSSRSVISSIAGKNSSHLEFLTRRYEIPLATTSYRTAIDRDDVDAVYVGLPNTLHHEMTMLAAEAGKAVLSEQPLSSSLRDAYALLGAVSNRVFFVEGLMYMAHPVIARYVEILRQGKLGALKSITAHYAADLVRLANPENRGAIYNLGCYPVSLVHLTVQTLKGEAAFRDRKVYGMGNVMGADGNIEESLLAVHLRDGPLVSIQVAETHGAYFEFIVVGENGQIRFLTNPWLPRAGKNVFIWSGFDGVTEAYPVEDPEDCFFHQTRMVENHVIDGDMEAERPSPRLRDSFEIMELLTEWERLAANTHPHMHARSNYMTN